MRSKRAIEVGGEVDPTQCPYVEDEAWPLTSIVVGVLFTSVAVAAFYAGENPVYGAIPLAIGWFLVPYGVYREAEVLERQGYIWSPGFKTIATASVPVLGAVAGVYYLFRRHGKSKR